MKLNGQFFLLICRPADAHIVTGIAVNVFLRRLKRLVPRALGDQRRILIGVRSSSDRRRSECALCQGRTLPAVLE